jgi:hypothetical protein
MSRFAEWCEGVPIAVCIAAKAFVYDLEDMARGLHAAQNEPLENVIPDFDVMEWISLYRNPRRLYGYIFSLPVGSYSFGDLLVACDSINVSIDDLFPDQSQFDLDKLIESDSEAQKLIDYFDAISEMEITEQLGAELEKQIEFQFLIRIWLPCCFLYQNTPAMLFRSARNGTMEDFFRLIRLDPFLDEDKKIRAINRKLERNNDVLLKNDLIKAKDGIPLAGLDPAEMKIFGSVVLIKIGHLCGYKFKTKKLLDFFHAISFDKYGQKNDLDFGPYDDPDSYRKRVRRKEKDVSRLSALALSSFPKQLAHTAPS